MLPKQWNWVKYLFWGGFSNWFWLDGPLSRWGNDWESVSQSQRGLKESVWNPAWAIGIEILKTQGCPEVKNFGGKLCRSVIGKVLSYFFQFHLTRWPKMTFTWPLKDPKVWNLTLNPINYPILLIQLICHFQNIHFLDNLTTSLKKF